MWAAPVDVAYWCPRCEIGEASPGLSPPPQCFVCDAEMVPRSPGWDPTRATLEE